ncbi:ABC transporter permease [Flavisolibacter sp. BT320]|nr:ABC transporter permease [Flavisolibacter longurius]
MNIAVSFRSELLKTKRSSIWYACVLIALVVPAILVLSTINNSEEISRLAAEPWQRVYRLGGQMLNLLMLPLFTVLVCTLLPQIEYRNNTWKQVLAAPQTYGQLFLSKLAVPLFMVLLFLLLFNSLLMMATVLLGTLYPTIRLADHPIDWIDVLRFNGQTLGAILGILGFQFWMGLRSKSFILPIGLGVGLWILSAMLAFEYKWVYADRFPFAFPFLSVYPKYAGKVPTMLWYSGGYCLLFLVLAFVEFRVRRPRA